MEFQLRQCHRSCSACGMEYLTTPSAAGPLLAVAGNLQQFGLNRLLLGDPREDLGARRVGAIGARAVGCSLPPSLPGRASTSLSNSLAASVSHNPDRPLRGRCAQQSFRYPFDRLIPPANWIGNKRAVPSRIRMVANTWVVRSSTCRTNGWGVGCGEFKNSPLGSIRRASLL